MMAVTKKVSDPIWSVFEKTWENFLCLLHRLSSSQQNSMEDSIYLNPQDYVQLNFNAAVLTCLDYPPCPLCPLYSHDRFQALSQRTLISYTVVSEPETGFEIVNVQTYKKKDLANITGQMDSQTRLLAQQSGSDFSGTGAAPKICLSYEDQLKLLDKINQFLGDWIVLDTCHDVFHLSCLKGFLADERKHCIVCKNVIEDGAWRPLHCLKSGNLANVPAKCIT